MNNLKEKLLNLSTFYKVLIANSVIITIGAVAGIWLTYDLSQRSALGLIVIFVVIGITLSILANFFILKAAFRPLNTLKKTVDAAYRGDLTARAARTPIGDPTINRLRDALNSMLEELSSNRKWLEDLCRQLREREKERSDLLRRIITTQEEERRRIARELHDETSQALASFIVGLKFAEGLTKASQLKQKLAELRALVAGTMDRIRHLAIELRPSLLDDLGLVSAIQSYASEYSSRTGIKVDYFLDDLSKLRLAPEVEVAVYRIIQETLANVAKHARASSVSVVAMLRNSALRIVVEDDGEGFDIDKVMEGAHEKRLGLLGMQERTSLIGGKFTIESQPGDGTTIFLEIPVELI